CGPLKHAPTELCVAGLGGFTRSLTFETKCPNGLKEDNGRPSLPPNLDVLVEEDNRILAIESKFIEPICPKNQKFSPKYEAPFRDSGEHPPDAEPEWATLYEAVLAIKKLSKDKQRFQRLDAAQLIKLALVLKGHAHSDLLDTYEEERKPIARFTVEQAYSRYVLRTAPWLQSTQSFEPLVDDFDIELGYLYGIPNQVHADPRSTCGIPGSRAPHVWLVRDGERVSTIDLAAQFV